MRRTSPLRPGAIVTERTGPTTVRSPSRSRAETPSRRKRDHQVAYAWEIILRGRIPDSGEARPRAQLGSCEPIGCPSLGLGVWV